jgi:hypothetical protein
MKELSKRSAYYAYGAHSSFVSVENGTVVLVRDERRDGARG